MRESVDGRVGLGCAILFEVMNSSRWAPTALRLALAVLLPAAIGCGDSTGLSQGSGALQVDRARIDFGRVFIGLAPIETVTVRNVGNAPLTFQVTLAGDAEGYAFGPGQALLGPNGSMQVQVLFRPRRTGERQALLSFSSDATNNATAAVDLVAVAVEVPDCEDGNGCTVDTFDLDTERCIHTAEALPCNDFNACTSADTCVDGICLGQGVLCDDGDVCTDDACDPEAGCVHIPTGACDDGNPCTRDICSPVFGCAHENLSDGTTCDIGEQCKTASICLGGQCEGVNIPDGQRCDDGDPCSDLERCIDGVCIDPTYTPPLVGEVAFTTTVAALAPGAAQNLIVDRNDTAFVGTEGGVTAIEECGQVQWVNDEIGTPQFSAAVSLPGLLTIPVGSRIHDLDSRDGAVIGSLDLTTALETVTASTATVTAQIIDIAVRASGALVASVTRTVTTTVSEQTEGYLIEVNALHTIATVLQNLGPRYASRVALDVDESVVAILRDGAADGGLGQDQLVRLGIDGVPGGSWSSSTIDGLRTDLALGPDGEVLWAAGLTRIDRQGELLSLLPPPNDPNNIRSGSPITFDTRVYALVQSTGGPATLVALTSTGGPTLFELPLPGPTIQHSPVVDAAGQVYLVTSEGHVLIVSPQGQIALESPLPLTSTPVEGITLTLTSRGFLLLAAEDTLFSIKGVNRLANSSWPRHRRDNLSTSHR